MSQLIRLWYLPHRRLAKAQASRSLAKAFAVRTHEVWNKMKGPTKIQTSSPTGWLCIHVWRLSLWWMKRAIISWHGSLMFIFIVLSHGRIMPKLPSMILFHIILILGWQVWAPHKEQLKIFNNFDLPWWDLNPQSALKSWSSTTEVTSPVIVNNFQITKDQSPLTWENITKSQWATITHPRPKVPSIKAM